MEQRQDSSEGKSNKNAIVQCAICAKAMRSDNLNRHMLTHNGEKPCSKCGKEIRTDQLNKHMLTHNPEEPCAKCGIKFRTDKLQKHQVLCEFDVNEEVFNRHYGVCDLVEGVESCESVKGFFKTFALDVVVDNPDYDIILKAVTEAAGKLLKIYQKRHPVKAQILVTLSFYKNDPSGEKIEAEKLFCSACEPILPADDLIGYLQRSISLIRLQIEQYERHGSGWIYEKFKCAQLDLAKYDPLSGGGKTIIPKKIKNMKSVLCINSPDTKCFLYSVIGGLLHAKDQLPNEHKHSHRYTKYLPHLGLVDDSMIKYPVSINQIKKFEQVNNLSISVFS